MKTKTEYIRLLRQYMTENASNTGISRMGIFGSVARGENTEQSDIDVLRGEISMVSLRCLE